MKERIENRLNELYYRRKYIRSIDWIKQKGLTKRQELEVCDILIEELEWLLSNSDIQNS